MVPNSMGRKYSIILPRADPKFRTVEGELVKVLHEIKMVSDLNIIDIHKIKFTRATRTDKHVHALQNFFSAKLMKSPEETLSDMRDKLAKALPSDIKLFCILVISYN